MLIMKKGNHCLKNYILPFECVTLSNAFTTNYFIEAKFLLLSADGRKCIFCREKIDPFFVQIVY